MRTIIISPGRSTSILRRASNNNTSAHLHRSFLQVRFYHYYQELSYESTGPVVADVLQHRRKNLDDVTDHHAGIGATSKTPMVKIQMLHAPWNPADANTVQGVYPIDLPPDLMSIRSSRHFPLATVAGSEGIGRVAELVVGTGTTNEEEEDDLVGIRDLSVGDYVTMGLPSLGTLRSTVWVPSHAVLKIARGRELVEATGGSAQAAALFQLGGTALRMLRDFQSNRSGESASSSGVVLQNAGNSAVGLMVSQLAAALGQSTVSLVRRGTRSDSELQTLVDHLMRHGQNAQVAIEEDLLANPAALKALQEQLRDTTPLLALNAVGGDSSNLLLKLLGPGGTMVTYGGMARKPVTLSASQLIFRNIQACGYWHSRWMSYHPYSEKAAMINELVDLVLDDKLKRPLVEVYSLQDYRQALAADAHQSTQAIRNKIVFACQEGEE